jgi:hypothetical protein
MGREVRRVPKNWKHPKNEDGNYIPLFGYSFSDDLAEWKLGNKKWKLGLMDDYAGGWIKISKKYKNMSYEEWDGDKPKKENYMPEWKEKELTHIMMYECTSEGTPISPAFKKPADLAAYLVGSEVSVFADITATYEQWLAMILAVVKKSKKSKNNLGGLK